MVELTREEPRDILSKKENKLYEYEIVNQWMSNSFLDTPKYERYEPLYNSYYIHQRCETS